MMERAVAFISDLHIGSRLALWPPHFVHPVHGQPMPLSPAQEQLWGYWEDFLLACDRWKVDTVCSMAEIINGKNPREHGRYQMEADMNVQAKAAIEVLKTIVTPSRSFWAVQGTEYHDGFNGKIEQTIVEHLGGAWFGPVKNVRLAGTNLTLNLCHGTGGSPVYSASLAEANLREHLISEALDKVPHVDLFVRGHIHTHFQVKKHQNGYLQCPAWQDFLPFKPLLRKIGLYQPDIGAVIVGFWKNSYVIREYLSKPPGHLLKAVRL